VTGGFSTSRAEFARAEANRGAPVRPGMRGPDRGLAVLRIMVGLWFLKGVLTKLTIALLWGVVPVPAASARWVGAMPRLLEQYMAENPITPLRHFVEQTVLSNPTLFANLTALGEAAVGIGLALGLLTALAATVGLLLSITYGLATGHLSPAHQGVHVLLATCMVVFLAARAGRRWGIDGWLRGRHARSILARMS
jgi:uncharacterized membrane protein YphA (DoxX/SURF4 family)